MDNPVERYFEAIEVHTHEPTGSTRLFFYSWEYMISRKVYDHESQVEARRAFALWLHEHRIKGEDTCSSTSQ